MQDTSHQELHQQLHQSALNHHQQALSHHQQVIDMHRNMGTGMGMGMGMTSMAPVMQQPQQPQQPMQIPYQAVSSPVPQQPQILYQNNTAQQNYQQPQIAYQTPPVPATTQPTQQYQLPQPIAAPLTRLPDRPQLMGEQHVQVPHQQEHMLQLPPVHNSAPQIERANPNAQQQPRLREIEQAPDNLAYDRTNREDYDDRFKALERKRAEDIKTMNREGAAISKRLQDLERTKAKEQKDSEVKDREIRRLNEQIAAKELQQQRDKEDQKRIRELETSRSTAEKEREIRQLKEEVASIERARRQAAERNSQQMADLVRSQATSPSSARTFDMSALQKVIRETQAQQLSAKDIERVIEEQLGKRLKGVASKADIQDAGQQMQGALSKVPPGLSEAQVQQAVSRELNNVMQDVANRMQRQQRKHQQMLAEGQQNQQLHDWQTSQAMVETDFVVEELPDDVVVPRSDHGRNQRTRKKQAALPPAPLPNRSSASVTAVKAPTRSRYAALEAASRVVEPGTQDPTPNKTYAAIEGSQESTTALGGALVHSGVPNTTNDALVRSRGGSEIEQRPNSAGHAQTNQADARGVSESKHIEAPKPQKQLEAKPSSQPIATTGQELVRQGKGLAKKSAR